MRAFVRHLPALGLVLLLAGCEIEPSPAEKERIKTKAEADAAKAPKPVTAEDAEKAASKMPELMSLAKKLADRGNDRKALGLLDQAIRINPTDREVLRLTARVTQSLAASLKRPLSSPYYLQSAEVMRQLIKAYPMPADDELQHLPTVYYNEACTLAVAGESDKAVKALNDAFESGFGDVDVLDADPELESLRKLPAFQEFVHKVETRHVGQLLASTTSFDFDFRLPDLEGKAVALDDFKGRVVLIDFWGTWCPPCRKEIPHLIELEKRYRDKNFRVVGINYEREKENAAKAAIKSFIEAEQIPYPCLLGDNATPKQIPNFKGFPTKLFIGSNGKVRLKLDGYQSLFTLDLIIGKILAEEEAGKAATK